MAAKKQKTGAEAKSGLKKAILELDGETFELVHDFNIMCEVEPLVGCNLLHGVSALLMSTATGTQMRGLFFAMLQTNHKFKAATKDKPESGVSLLRAGQMIRLETLPAITEAMIQAIALTVKTPVEPEAAPNA